jgi:nitrite reductase/ring-hydroxylating ferredoxin subunit
VRKWLDVATLAQIERDGRAIVRVGGREIGVVAANGELRAIRNRCPHHGAPLCLGTVRQREGGLPGSYTPSNRTVLRCPWHGWEFDLDTGSCPEDPSMRVATYEVRVVGERVEVLA